MHLIKNLKDFGIWMEIWNTAASYVDQDNSLNHIHMTALEYYSAISKLWRLSSAYKRALS